MVLARIIRLVGSGPRHVGAGCLIGENGELTGTIGGGRLEFEVMERAKKVFEIGETVIMPYRMTGAEVAENEMLCGGLVDVYLEPLFPENETVQQIFKSLAELIQTGQAGTLISRVSDGIGWNDATNRLLVGPEEKTIGALGKLSADLNRRFSQLNQIRNSELVDFETDNVTVFVAPIRADDVVYLFGAGHISLFVASLAKMVGFTVVVIDDRETFANDERFPQADRVMVTPFDDAFDQINVNRSSYVVIVTRGHAHDRNVLNQALNFPAAYIGMIGSRRKIQIIYESLMARWDRERSSGSRSFAHRSVHWCPNTGRDRRFHCGRTD